MRKSVYRDGSWDLLKSCTSGVNHGTFLHIAHEEGLIRNTSMHAGIRAPMVRPKGDLRNDVRCGFEIVKAREIDQFGVAGVIARLKSRVAGTKVYISVDIDVLDPAFAPGKSLYGTYHCATQVPPYQERSFLIQQHRLETPTPEGLATV
jgi:arginase family enzyme